MTFASRASFCQVASASLAAAILAGCGGGSVDTDDKVNATSAAKATGIVTVSGSSGSMDCASTLESLVSKYGANVDISCNQGTLRLQEKNGEAVQVASTGPWVDLASGVSRAKDEVLPHVDFGGGGGAFSTVLCPTVIGATGRSGSYIDSISIVCAVGNTLVSVGPFGGGGGGPYTLGCPVAGFIGIGIQGRSGSFVDRLGFVCGDSVGNRLTTTLTGGFGGGEFYFECPSNEKLVGFNVRSGSYVDNLQPLCGTR